MDFNTFFRVLDLYREYSAVLDQEKWDRWPDLFTDDCIYMVQPRENYDRGLPLATISLESKGMLIDRIYGATETIYHDPYYQRHVVDTPRILGCEDGVIQSEANYAVFRTKANEMSTVYNVGRYIDRIRLVGARALFESRICVFDSETIPNSLIYPI